MSERIVDKIEFKPYKYSMAVELLKDAKSTLEDINESLINSYNYRLETGKTTRYILGDCERMQFSIDILEECIECFVKLRPIVIPVEDLSRGIKSIKKREKTYQFIIEVDEVEKSIRSYFKNNKP